MIHTGMTVKKLGSDMELKVVQINSKGQVLLSDLTWYKKEYLREVNNECWLEREPFYQCCCTCINRVSVNLHCHEEHDREGCICGTHTGFACTGFENEGLIQANWPEHSIGCEMHTTKEQAEKWKAKSEAA
jgi:hypothetical protein